MTRASLRIIVFVAILTLLVGTSGRPFQQRTPDGGLFFPDTQKSVKGEFLQFFQQAERNVLIFGFPISDPMPNPLKPEIQVQYFQRARMELDTTKPVGSRVSLTPLGAWLRDEAGRGKDANIDISSAACRFFEASGHYVCYAFLQYYDSNRGSVFFGNPISEVEIVDGRMVQYFEYARMEWRADLPVGSRVTLTDLGTLYFPGPTAYNPNSRDPNNISSQLGLTVRVFPAKPLIGANEQQTVYVVVQTPAFTPVSGAAVKVTVHMADGSVSVFRPVETNAQGFTAQENIAIPGFKPNDMVYVDVEVLAPGEVLAKATTWFRVWW